MSLSGRLGRGVRKRQSHPIALHGQSRINRFQRKLARARQTVRFRDDGGWVGREEEAEEGVVEVKGKAGSPGCDGDGGGASTPKFSAHSGGWTGLVYRRRYFAPAYSVFLIYFSLLSLHYHHNLLHRSHVQLFCMRFPASFAAYVTRSRVHLQGEIRMYNANL